jgi:hypothetical protein
MLLCKPLCKFFGGMHHLPTTGSRGVAALPTECRGLDAWTLPKWRIRARKGSLHRRRRASYLVSTLAAMDQLRIHRLLSAMSRRTYRQQRRQSFEALAQFANLGLLQAEMSWSSIGVSSSPRHQTVRTESRSQTHWIRWHRPWTLDGDFRAGRQRETAAHCASRFS